jgi:hypothetical protein
MGVSGQRHALALDRPVVHSVADTILTELPRLPQETEWLLIPNTEICVRNDVSTAQD